MKKIIKQNVNTRHGHPRLQRHTNSQNTHSLKQSKKQNKTKQKKKTEEGKKRRGETTPSEIKLFHGQLTRPEHSQIRILE